MNLQWGYIYLLKCGEFLKVGFTAGSIDARLQNIRAGIPYQVDVLMTRAGSWEEEQEFHHEHTDFLCGYGGREWYHDTPVLRQDAESFLKASPNQEQE